MSLKFFDQFESDQFRLLPDFGFEKGGEYLFKLFVKNFTGISIFLLPHSNAEKIISKKWGLKGFCQNKSRGSERFIHVYPNLNRTNIQNLSGTISSFSIIRPLIINCNKQRIAITGYYYNTYFKFDTRLLLDFWGSFIFSIFWLFLVLIFIINSLKNLHYCITIHFLVILFSLLQLFSLIVYSRVWKNYTTTDNYSISLYYLNLYFHSFLFLCALTFVLLIIDGYGTFQEILSYKALFLYIRVPFGIAFMLVACNLSQGIIWLLSVSFMILCIRLYVYILFNFLSKGEKFLVSYSLGNSQNISDETLAKKVLLSLKFTWSFITWSVIWIFIHFILKSLNILHTYSLFSYDLFDFGIGILFFHFLLIQSNGSSVRDIEEDVYEPKTNIPSFAYLEEPLSSELNFLDNNNNLFE